MFPYSERENTLLLVQSGKKCHGDMFLHKHATPEGILTWELKGGGTGQGRLANQLLSQWFQLLQETLWSISAEETG